MPAISKNLTERTSLRYTIDEDTIISNVVREYAEAGITISRNDAIRVGIRRAGTPLPADDVTAWNLVTSHTGTCPHCTVDAPMCPEGRWYGSLYDRLFLTPAQRITQPAPAPQQAAQRRTVSGRRPLLPPSPGTKAG